MDFDYEATLMPTQDELFRLLLMPNESLTLEYKSWLDISTNQGKAVLAKAAIALANEGGGIIIFGMRSGENQGLAPQQRPDDLRRYEQDAVNSAINRFAEPEIHCELAFARHPTTNTEHAFLLVPGGMTVPVMSVRDYQGELMAQKCYIRKPGPRSEEPFTAEEWGGVLERCLHARRESMLDAIRLIVQGHLPPSPPAPHLKSTQFCERAARRWEQLIVDLPADDIGRMTCGCYQLCFGLVNVQSAPTFIELRQRMLEASRVRHTGWGPFVSLERDDLAPTIVDEAIEAWLGAPEPERHSRSPQHCDFWRVSRDGLFYLQRGFDEDGTDRVDPGTTLDVTMPIWRVGEAFLYVSRIASLFGDNPDVYARVRYIGLQARELKSLNRQMLLMDGRRSADDEVALETQATASQIDDNLVEIIHTLLSPLYERFQFFELPLELVTREIDRMRRNRF